MKRTITALAAITIALGTLTACFPLPSISKGSDDAGPPPSVEEPIESPSPEPVEEKSGTYDNPAAVGSVINLSDATSGTSYDLTLSVVSWDATGAVAAANQFNDAPRAGYQFMLASITIVNNGTAPVSPSSAEWSIQFLGADNTASGSASVVAPAPTWMDVPDDIYPGGSATFNIPFEVPAGSVDGVWVIGLYDPFYVEAA